MLGAAGLMLPLQGQSEWQIEWQNRPGEQQAIFGAAATRVCRLRQP
jgi:hypothetical protein